MAVLNILFSILCERMGWLPLTAYAYFVQFPLSSLISFHYFPLGFCPAVAGRSAPQKSPNNPKVFSLSFLGPSQGEFVCLCWKQNKYSISKRYSVIQQMFDQTARSLGGLMC